MQNNIVNHHQLGTYIVGAAVVNHIVTVVSQQGPFLQGCASIATILGVGISIFFSIRNRRK